MKHKALIVLLTVISAGLIFATFSFGQEMPKPGTIIDKNNYKKYAHLYPEELTPFFENGYGGLLPPLRMKVAEGKQIPFSRKYLEYSEKNKGKYSLTPKGDISPAFNSDGMPFPGLSRNDKDFVTKLMWNYAFRYIFDDLYDKGTGGSFEKRRGEPVRYNTASETFVYFKGRMFTNPKPNLDNPIGLYKAMIFHFILPDSIKNTINMGYRYADTTKSDDTYLYLPAMRRVLRAEAGQRSTPLLGSVQSLDDFFGHDGRTPEFTYTLVKEQKMLVGATKCSLTAKAARAWNKNELPWAEGDFELRDVYVVDIKAKDPKYPQGRKRICMDKETLVVYYSTAWDRAGKMWKQWILNYELQQLSPAGDVFQHQSFLGGVDIQFGLATAFVPDDVKYFNRGGFAYTDFTPTELLKKAR